MMNAVSAGIAGIGGRSKAVNKPVGPAETLRTERLAASFRQLPLTLAVMAINAVLAVVVVAPVAPVALLIGWVGAVALLVLLRGAIWWRFTHAPARIQAADVWDHASVLGALLSGVLWGVFGLAIVPLQQPYLSFAAFLVAGLCAGAATVHSPHRATVLAFVVPATMPLGVRLCATGDRVNVVMGAMTLIFGTALLLIAGHFSALFGETVLAREALVAKSDLLARALLQLRREARKRRDVEARLFAAQKLEAIGSLTAGIAHDFNNLLMVVLGSTEILKERVPAEPAITTRLEAIGRACDRGHRMIRQLLAFARKEQLAPAPADINILLRETASLLSDTLGARVRVTFALREPLWPVVIDHAGFERAVINLAVNARDAMPLGGTLAFRSDQITLRDADEIDDLPAGDYVTVDVSDTGVGMPPGVLARAFDPFFTTKPPGFGSGLGLSHVYGTMKQSGGTTVIKSALGEGTTVRLLLPRAVSNTPLAADRIPAVKQAQPAA
jgi:signal transduction histidine kinase